MKHRDFRRVLKIGLAAVFLVGMITVASWHGEESTGERHLRDGEGATVQTTNHNHNTMRATNDDTMRAPSQFSAAKAPQPKAVDGFSGENSDHFEESIQAALRKLPPARTTTAAHSMEVFESSDWNDPVALLERLYPLYKDDLVRVNQLAAQFCASQEVPMGWPHNKACMSETVEMEILYLRLRLLRPEHVLELSSAVGYSTLWMLQALEDNGYGTLHSFDVFETPVPFVLSDSAKSRWHFTFGDALETLSPASVHPDYDYLLIDTAHMLSFTQWYTRSVLERFGVNQRDRSVMCQVHDINVGPNPSGECVAMLYWLAISQSAFNVFSLSQSVSLSADALAPRIEGVRAVAYGADMPPDPQPLVKGRATLFFELWDSGRGCKGCLNVY